MNAPTTPSKMVGFLDIETLSLRLNALVLEIGLVTVLMDETYGQLDSPQIFHWKLDHEEQLRMGRHVDPSTYEFHLKIHGDNLSNVFFGFEPTLKTTYDPIFERNSLLNPNKACLPPKLVLDDLRSKCSNLSELWMNHPTLDSGRLHSLKEDVWADDEPLWKYHIERDVATLRRVTPSFYASLKNELPKETAHRAVDDAFYNLRVVQLFGRSF